MKQLYLFILVVFCCIGCQRNTLQGPIPTIAMHPDSCLKSLDISVLMKDSIEVIKLETTDSCLIGFINKISFTDKYILVSDARVSQKIYLFDKEGKFIRYISNKGNGPGEYSVIGDFTIKGDSVFIQDYYQNKYVVYDMVADEIKDDIPYNAHHSGVVALDNYLYFISNYFTSPIGDYNCFRYDLSMRKTEGYLPFTADRIANEPAWTINHPCGRIDKLKSFAYYRSNDTIFLIDKLTVSPQCVIHFPNGEDRTSSTQGGHISGIVHLQQSAGYILGTYTEGKGLRFFLIDKRDYSSQMGKLLRFNSLDRKSINNEFFIEDNYLIFWDTMQSLKLWRRYFDKAEFTNPADKQRIQSIIDLSQDDDNPVIFRCRVK